METAIMMNKPMVYVLEPFSGIHPENYQIKDFHLSINHNSEKIIGFTSSHFKLVQKSNLLFLASNPSYAPGHPSLHHPPDVGKSPLFSKHLDYTFAALQNPFS